MPAINWQEQAALCQQCNELLVLGHFQASFMLAKLLLPTRNLEAFKCV